MPKPDTQSNLLMPQVIGLVITNDKKINICPVNWQVVSTKYEDPMTVCIALSHTSHTLEAIRNTKEFVYAYPHKDQLKDSLYCGTVSGNDVDKIGNIKFEFLDSKTMKTPCLKGAIINMECTLHQLIEMNNYTIIIGVIKQIHESKTFNALDKVYALGGMNYGIIEKVNVLQEGRV